MNHRLLVNPGTPQAWEIVLQPGVNRIGRGEANDFQIPHGSVSGAHCEFVVTHTGVTLRDLGSTNGSFINRAPVREAVLQSGQHIQLGSVDMIFEAAVPPAPVTAAPPLPVPIGAAPPSAAPPPPVVRIHLGGSPAAAPVPTPAAAPPAAPVAPVRIVLPVAAASSAPPAPPPPVAPQPGGLRLSGLHKAAPEPAAPAAVVEAAETEPPLAPPLAGVAPSTGTEVCKFHAKIPARFYCGKCQKYFCDMCVATHSSSSGSVRTCRQCASHVTPIQVKLQRAAGPKGFFARLPGAFVYPFRGMGVFMLIVLTILVICIQGGGLMLGSGGVRGPALGFIAMILAAGYMFAYMQAVIHTTAAEDREMPQLPGVSNIWDDILVPCLQLLVMTVVCYGPAIALGIGAIALKMPVLGIAMIPAFIIGCIYFPMAFLALNILDSVTAVNPLVIVPSILRVPGEYLITLIILAAVLVMRWLGDIMIAMLFPQGFSTKSMAELFTMVALWAFWAIMKSYLLTVNMRVLGELYVAKKERLGWLNR